MTAYFFGGPKDGLRLDDQRNVHEFVFPINVPPLPWDKAPLAIVVHSYTRAELLDGQWGQFVYRGTRKA